MLPGQSRIRPAVIAPITTKGHTRTKVRVNAPPSVSVDSAHAIIGVIRGAADAVGELIAAIATGDFDAIGARMATDPSKGRNRVVVDVFEDRARVSVADNGVGLPKSERHRLTEPYMTTRVKGTGLGLAIVKKVVEEHGGALHFDDCSNFGPTGAIVSVMLPLSQASEQGKSAAAAE